jgi:hypothetical protein
VIWQTKPPGTPTYQRRAAGGEEQGDCRGVWTQRVDRRIDAQTGKVAQQEHASQIGRDRE